MDNTSILRGAAALAIALAFAPAGSARADTGVPLYVAEAGVDRGDCTDRVAPCRSIGYALEVAGKNARIRVAAGSYHIDDPSDLIYMVSGAVNVSGGYPLDDSPSASGGRSMITGVPIEYRDRLRARGFHVIVDSKGIDIEKAKTAKRLFETLRQSEQSTAATPCTGGTSAGFACDDIDLLSHTARQDISAGPSAVADIWGFVDLNTNREYAIVGVSIGTAIFDVTDPENPREIDFVDGQSATWRDVKVYQFFDDAAGRWRAYAYVTTDGATNGLFVIDLGGLPHSISRVPYASDFSNAHNVYITNVDYGTGLSLTTAAPQLIVAGSGINNGQFRTYSLANPAAPAFVQRVASAGYMHDATSLRIDDSRMSQCAAAGAPCEVIIDFNEQHVELWDVTNAASPVRLVQVPQYLNRGYVHSGWWSEDRQYIFVHDELDEQRSGLNTTLRVFSLANLSNPTLAGTWPGPTRAVDHNGFVRGNRYYMSNYTRGLTILDISNPASPTESGFFDTFGANDTPVFAGAWGAYPFFHSGTVAVSDINSGMYLFADRTRDVPQGSLAFDAPSFDAPEGQQALLQVSRQGGVVGAVSVDYEIVAATAGAADYQAITGTLTWAAGNSSPQSIVIDIPDDGAGEGLEHAIVRLVNPVGGATLGTVNVASLYVSDAGAVPEIQFFADTVGVTERGFGKAVIVVQRTGSATGAVSVDYTVSGGDAVIGADFTGAASGSIAWADGDAAPKSIEYDIVDDGTGEQSEFFELTLSNVVGATVAGSLTARVTVEDGAGVNTAPNAIAGPDQTRQEGATVTLDGSQSNDPEGDTLTYTWSQTDGPGVTLSNQTSVSASFTAPNVSSDTLLRFQLVVTDPGGLTGSATTSVMVTNSGGNPPGVGGRSGGSGSPAPLALLVVGLVLLRRVSRTDCA